MQRIFAGRLEQAYREELSRLRTADAVSKMWAGQPALWSVDPVQGKLVVNRLGWISILDQMRAEAAALADLGREMDAAGLRDLVLLGMGGSVLAAEAFSRMFPHPPRRGRFLVLDSTDPESILEVQRQIDLPRTMFVVASKSGRTIGILSQFFYFHHRVQQAGIRPPGSRFIAITDGSYLDQLATDYKFRRTYRKPSDIGGSYSALSYFGLVPAALWSVDVAGVLDSAMEMRVTCEPQAPAEANPALELGALLSAATKNGADQLVLLSTPKLVPLGHWIEDLVAKSTGKEGRGIVPVAGDFLRRSRFWKLSM